jgi:mannose-1-phosphate guanylyltransferase/mannose-1-phosphate guanylyltransferase/mannose-6-phosphate isomerase
MTTRSPNGSPNGSGSSSGAPRVHPVILAGGTGSRLWPLSRVLYPKQFLPLIGEKTMLQETVLRFTDDNTFAAPIVLCNDEHRFIVAEQLRAIGRDPDAIILEPAARSTAPAAAVAALRVAEHDPDGMLLVLPADHVIRKPEKFAKAVAGAARTANGRLVTFGIKPNAPETGYGYIKQGKSLAGFKGAFSIAKFVEKPTLATARKFLSGGGYAWNSGIFLFGAQAFLDELEKFEPKMLASCRAAVDAAKRDLDFIRLDAEAFGRVKADSIDYAVMEKTRLGAVVPIDMGWNDIGSWTALWDLGKKDRDGNVAVGNVTASNVKGSYLRSEGPLLTVVGLNDVIAVATKDAVMVTSRSLSQEVKALVAALDKKGAGETKAHSTVYRPWGSYQSIDGADGFQVKRIIVKPGQKLSLQKHAKRAEHWVIVRGTARITRDRDVYDLVANQSTYIPLGAVHRLENPGTDPLHLIEVQSGDYLGEDDIVRLEDTYGRS